MNLDGLGDRICVMGPSNSGKSTLAAAIGRKKGFPVIYLDRYRFAPGLHWVERSDAEFTQMHEQAISGDKWVIEGNYSRWLPRRLERASGLLMLDASVSASLRRYIGRTWSKNSRVGGLEGVHDAVSWNMIRFIVGQGQRNRTADRELFDDLQLPKLLLPNREALEQFYRREQLSR